jgi:prophage regulatory protein
MPNLHKNNAHVEFNNALGGTDMTITIQRLPKIQTAFGLSRSSVSRHIAEGLLPKPVHIGSRAVGFPSHEVEAIVQARISGASESTIRQLVIDLTTQRTNLLSTNLLKGY